MKRSVYWASLIGMAVVVGVPLVGVLTDPQASVRDLFRLGIDLEGGTSLIYVLKPAEEGGEPPPAADVKKVIMDRIDPTGTRGYVVRPVGKHRLEIVLPGRRTRVDLETGAIGDEVLKAEVPASWGAAGLPPDLEAWRGKARVAARVNPALNRFYVRQRIDAAVREQFGAEAPLWRLAGIGSGDEEPREFDVWVDAPAGDEERVARWRALLGRALVGQSDVDRVKSLVGQAGHLEFRIVADKERDRQKANFDRIIREKQAGKPSPSPRFRWYPMRNGYDRFKSGALDRWNFAYVIDRETEMVEVLLDVGDGQDVTGDDLSRAGPDSKAGDPIVSFRMRPQAEGRMARLTRKENRGRYMAIILDGTVTSAPYLENVPLSRGGIIHGYRDTAERDEVVTILNSGKLAASLGDPVAERTVGPELGADNIRKGFKAVALGFVLVVAFMAIYYLGAGLVADVALVLNLVLIVCIMHWVRQAWTLPGIAGLILTIGMSVDANVLIFERIREEKGREGSLGFALRRAYSRAFRTILDANVTTLIPAFILLLPQLATEEVKGFAVVIVVGILTSMFTALVVTRMVFETSIRLGVMKQLRMLQLMEAPRLNWMRFARVAIVISAAAMLAGAVAFYSRGREKYDIEFTGGTQVELSLAMPDDLSGVAMDAEVRRRVGEALGPTATIQRLDLEGRTGAENIQQFLISVSSVARSADGAPAAADEAGVKSRLTAVFGDMQPETRKASVQTEVSEITEETINERMGIERGETGGESSEVATVRYIPPEERQFLGKVRVVAEVEPALTVEDARYRLEAFLKDRYADLVNVPYRVDGVGTPGADGAYEALDIWVAVDHAGSRGPAPNPDFWDEVARKALGSEDAFASTTSFEPTLAGETWDKAVMAIVFSLIAIVLYMWFRFAKVGYGLAAVMALVHDVFIVLGAVAFCSWALPATGLGRALLITDMKINLPMVGAFLTLIGYSLNDTIVVFDRIRENRGKFGDLSVSVANRSINQTLTRTIWTSLTTLMVVAVLYTRGGTASTLHGFSFVLTLGVLVGTYSSIAIASPILVLRHYLRRAYAYMYPVLGVGLLAYYMLVWADPNEFFTSWRLVLFGALHVAWIILVAPGILSHAQMRPWLTAERMPLVAKALALMCMMAVPGCLVLCLMALVRPQQASVVGPAALWALVQLPAVYALYQQVWGGAGKKG